jgi:hypothetical protein
VASSVGIAADERANKNHLVGGNVAVRHSEAQRGLEIGGVNLPQINHEFGIVPSFIERQSINDAPHNRWQEPIIFSRMAWKVAEGVFYFSFSLSEANLIGEIASWKNGVAQNPIGRRSFIALANLFHDIDWRFFICNEEGNLRIDPSVNCRLVAAIFQQECNFYSCFLVTINEGASNCWINRHPCSIGGNQSVLSNLSGFFSRISRNSGSLIGSIQKVKLDERNTTQNTREDCEDKCIERDRIMRGPISKEFQWAIALAVLYGLCSTLSLAWWLGWLK